MFWLNDPYLNEVWEKAIADPIPDERNLMDLYPSMMGVKDKNGKHHGQCTRKMYYMKLDPSGKDPDISGFMRMNEGNLFEAHANAVFQKAQVAIKPNGIEGQVRIAIPRKTAKGTEYTVAGRLDIVYRNAQKKRAIIDWKRPVTPNSADDVFGTSKWHNNPPSPKTQNVIQMAVYAEWASKLGIDDCRLAYAYPPEGKGIVFGIEVKDNEIFYFNPEKKENSITSMPFTLDAIYEEADHLADCMKEEEVPDFSYDAFFSEEELNAMAFSGSMPKKWEAKRKEFGKLNKPYGQSLCSYCEYVTVCRGKEEAELLSKLKDF
jgi:hypothetical protein